MVSHYKHLCSKTDYWNEIKYDFQYHGTRSFVNKFLQYACVKTYRRFLSCYWVGFAYIPIPFSKLRFKRQTKNSSLLTNGPEKERQWKPICVHKYARLFALCRWLAVHSSKLERQTKTGIHRLTERRTDNQPSRHAETWQGRNFAAASRLGYWNAKCC